ncbi:SRPBCC family protein [soil metagenome]
MEKAHVLHCFDAPPAKVFAAWLDPAEIGEWMFGPEVRDETIVSLENDPVVGGRFRFVVDRAGQRLEHVGEYLEIVPGQRLVFTWGVGDQPPSTVKLVIAPFGGGSQLDLVHDLGPAWSQHIDKIRAGWSVMLDALSHRLAEKTA